MIRRVNLALMETVLAERRRQRPATHPLAEYINDWMHVHTLAIREPIEHDFTISLRGQDDPC